MKSATFEVTTLADAISKANRVAPNKGSAFDKAAGIVIDVDPLRFGENCIITATDLEVSVRIVVSTLEMGDEPAVWRVPSRLIHGLMGSLPVSTGAQIELRDTGDAYLYIKCGKTKGKLLQVVGNYPIISTIDPASLTVAPNLANRLSQVAWATSKRGTGALSGVHMDGEHLWGCSTASMVRVPCTVPLTSPVTAPLTEIASIIKNTGEVQIGATPNRLNLMPDPYTQATCVLIEEPYPNLKGLIEQHNKSNDQISLSADALVGMLDRTLVLIKEERAPSTNIEIGENYLKMSLSTDVGLIQDELEVIGGGVAKEPIKLAFSAENLKSAVMASGRPSLTLSFGPTARDAVRLSDDNNYLAVMMPMVAR
jgi:DNA polymerase III sliding clamp (beta) subunit (PCNA family)